MEWVAVAVAIIAAGFAGWQAWEARKSRLAASASQSSAETAASTAADAQAQSAASLGSIAEIIKEQHDAARAAASVKPDPWRLESGSYRKNGEARLLVLGGDEDVYDVELKWERAPRMLHLDPEPISSTMRPGDAIEVYWMKVMGDASTFVMEVHWRREGDVERSITRATLG